MSELVWRKSSYSDPGGGDCVEVAMTSAAVQVRDSKRRSGPVLGAAPAAWDAFLGAVRRPAADGDPHGAAG